VSRPPSSAFRTPFSAFRLVAIAEAITWTLLIAALVLRATIGWDAAVTAAGGIHGFVFLSYAATAILVALNGRWQLGPAVVAVVSAVIPYATIPVERWLARGGLLAGEWRTGEPGPGAEAERWYDRLLRWFLRRPWVLVLVIAGAVAMLFVVLLIVGPPGGRH
jgi:integral membrane protein